MNNILQLSRKLHQRVDNLISKHNDEKRENKTSSVVFKEWI